MTDLSFETQWHTFNWAADDRAAYALGDAAAAVHLARKAPFVSVDIETAGLGEDQWDVKAFSIGDSQRAVVLDPTSSRDRKAIRECLTVARAIVLHNSCFDVPILVASGLMPLSSVDKVEDTLVMARMAYPSERVSKALPDACSRYLDERYEMWKTSLEQGYKAVTGRTKREMFRDLGLHSPAYVAYAAFDVIMTSRLYEVLPQAVASRLSDHPFPSAGTADAAALLYREQTVNRMLLRRSAQGIEVDFAVVDELKSEMAALVARCDADLATYGVDTSLSRELMKRDLVRVLDAQGRLPSSHKRLANGTPSADKRYLSKISHPAVDLMETRAQADRFASDYADKLVHLSHPATRRVHPQVAVLVARTGRMSYADPPIQQFPAGVRRMMRFDVPATSLDWSSIEPVIAANLAGDAAVLEEFESGGDLYLPIARAAGVDRATAKTILLAQLYGQGAPSLATRLGIDEDEARTLIGGVMGRMPGVRGMVRRIRAVGDAYGVVLSVSGRVLPLDPDPRSGGTKFFGYTGVNFTIQSSAYDLLAEALLAMHREGLDDALLAAVHDELVVATEAAHDVERIMATPPACLVEAAGRVPVLRTGRTDMGRHWLAKES